MQCTVSVWTDTDLPLRASYMPPWLLSPLPSQHQHRQHLDHLIFRLIIIYHSNIFIHFPIKYILSFIYHEFWGWVLPIVLRLVRRVGQWQCWLGCFFPRKFHLSRLQGQDKVRGGDRAEEISDQTCRTCLTMRVIAPTTQYLFFIERGFMIVILSILNIVQPWLHVCRCEISIWLPFQF